MSTTFDIIPTQTIDITFGQVIQTSTRHIQAFLASLNIQKPITLQVALHDNEGKYKKKVQLDSLFTWQANEYAWFTIEGVRGGTDAYCEILRDTDIDPENPWWFLEEIKSKNEHIHAIDEKLTQAKNLNRKWWFRRSAGQPGIINLSYGLISAAVATLTGGLLWSDDGAWNHQRFPAESEAFLQWYLRPEFALKKEDEEWARECIAGLREDLGLV